MDQTDGENAIKRCVSISAAGKETGTLYEVRLAGEDRRQQARYLERIIFVVASLYDQNVVSVLDGKLEDAFHSRADSHVPGIPQHQQTADTCPQTLHRAVCGAVVHHQQVVGTVLRMSGANAADFVPFVVGERYGEGLHVQTAGHLRPSFMKE